jgi:hypothetical protein
MKRMGLEHPWGKIERACKRRRDIPFKKRKSM